MYLKLLHEGVSDLDDIMALWVIAWHLRGYDVYSFHTVGKHIYLDVLVKYIMVTLPYHVLGLVSEYSV